MILRELVEVLFFHQHPHYNDSRSTSSLKTSGADLLVFIDIGYGRALTVDRR